MTEPPTILAVDDTPSVLAALVALLTPEGYLVRTANSGELALAAAAANPPDLILLDFQMRRMDGTEVCQRLRANEATRHIPIILISGCADVEDWVAGLQAGAADYITKPFQSEELLLRVRTHLALRRARLALEEEAVMLYQTTTRLEAEIVRRQRVEDELRRSLEQAERSRRALLSALEDQKRAEESLRRSQALNAAIVESTSDMIWSVDSERFGLLSFNHALGDYFLNLGIGLQVGMRPEDMVPTKEFRDRWHGLYQRALAEGAYSTDYVGIAGSAEMQLTFGILERNGKVFGISVFGRDITERKQAEKRREQLEAQILQSQKMESIGRLAGGVAHDFNNCLNVIQGFTQMCLANLREGEPLADHLGQVLKASDRAASLTRQLLAFGRKQVLQPEVLDLNRVLAEMEKMLRRIIGEDIELVHLPTPDLGLVKADPGQFGQVIMNLAVNARDAMPEGGRLTIETKNVQLDAGYAARHEEVAVGPYVMVAVTDTGIGMDEQTISRLFEPFFTTKSSGRGTGLGLSTAYGIVKQSGGSICVESEVGRGTTFKLYLPRELSATATAAAKPRPIPLRATGDETILVVEDEEALRQLTARLLENAGYTVLSAADGEQALATSERHAGHIDLLLTDVVMPRMNGRLLAERLTKTRPALKILYMSGYTDGAILHHGVLDAGTQFLAKPFSEVELTRKVRAVLDGTATTSGTDWPAIKDESEDRPVAANARPTLAEDAPANPVQAAAGVRRDESDGEDSKILVVDDSVDNLRLLTAVLKHGGLVPRPVTSGRQAVKAAEADPPDLVLLDMRMPEMSGLEVCRCFKQDERLRDIPIIFISGVQGSDDKIEGFRAGGVDFVSKPFLAEELLARIKTHLRLRRLKAELLAYQQQLGLSK